MHINKFLDVLQSKLPEICTDRDLVLHLPNFFKNPCTITRLRAQGRCPPFFSIAPHIYYLKDDVICWLRERYQSEMTQHAYLNNKKISKPAKCISGVVK